MSAQTLYGGTSTKGFMRAQNGDGSGFADKNPYWPVGLAGGKFSLPGEGSIPFNDLFGYMDSPASAPSGQNVFDILRFNMDSPLRIPLQSNFALLDSPLTPSQSFNPLMSRNDNGLTLMRGFMDRVNPQIPFNSSLLDSSFMSQQSFNIRPSLNDNGLSMMRSLMDGPFHNVVYTSNNNPIDFLRGFMDPPPLNFNGLTPIEFISALGSGRINPRLPLTPIDRVASQFVSVPPIEPVILKQIPIVGSPVRTLGTL